MRSTTLNVARSKRGTSNHLPDKVGAHSKRVDAALPGKHTIYDRLSWKEASVLAQLRTGMARLNDYLYRLGVVPSDQRACGQARETVEHFLFRCCTSSERGRTRPEPICGALTQNPYGNFKVQAAFSGSFVAASSANTNLVA